MLTFNKNFRRRVSRDMADDLSIVKGIAPVRHITSFRKQAKKVRNYPSDLNLLRHFLTARENAMPSEKKVPAVNAPNANPPRNENSGTAHYTVSPYFTTENKAPITTFRQCQQQMPVSRGLCQFGGRPKPVMISMPSSAKAVNRVRRELFATPLQPVSQNSQYGGGRRRMESEVEYWASLAGSGRNKKASGYNDSSAGVASASDWAVSSGPITRNDAYKIQQEMASSLSVSSGSSGNCGGFFGNGRTPVSSILTPGPLQAPLQADENFPVHRTPMRSLLRSIQPPSSTPLSQLHNPSVCHPCWTPDQHRGVVQGAWISRDNLRSTPTVSKQFSIAQLIDMLTGDAVPPTSEIAGDIFQPVETVNDAVDFVNVVPSAAAYPVEMPITPTPDKSPRKKKENKRKRPDIHEINRSWFPMQDEEDNAEESIYFKNNMETPAPSRNPMTSSKPKSVSFLTDGENNLAIETFWFDKSTPTQEEVSNSATAFFDINKENQGSQPGLLSANQEVGSFEEFLQQLPPPPASVLGSRPSTQDELFFCKPFSQSVIRSTFEQNSEPETFLNNMSNDVVLDTQATFTY